MTKSEDIEEGIVEEEEEKPEATSFWTSVEVVLLLQKIFAELVGSYFLLFIGGGSVAVNKKYGSVSFPGISLCWGLVVMALVYSVGHISGAHFNPAVTVTFAVFRRFPLKQACNFSQWRNQAKADLPWKIAKIDLLPRAEY